MGTRLTEAERAKRNSDRVKFGRTTKTPEKSTSTSIETEREALAGAYTGKAELAQQRGAVSEQQLPEPVHAEPVIGEKVTSPELASLAARYASMSNDAMYEATKGGSLGGSAATRTAFFEDVRRLAASVLSQAEGGVK
jgi:hypothetical protein